MSSLLVSRSTAMDVAMGVVSSLAHAGCTGSQVGVRTSSTTLPMSD